MLRFLLAIRLKCFINLECLYQKIGNTFRDAKITYRLHICCMELVFPYWNIRPTKSGDIVWTCWGNLHLWEYSLSPPQTRSHLQNMSWRWFCWCHSNSYWKIFWVQSWEWDKESVNMVKCEWNCAWMCRCRCMYLCVSVSTWVSVCALVRESVCTSNNVCVRECVHVFAYMCECA